MTTAQTLQEAREILEVMPENIRDGGSLSLLPDEWVAIIEADKAKDELIEELLSKLSNVRNADFITSCQECGFGSSPEFEQVLEVIEKAKELGYKP